MRRGSFFFFFFQPFCRGFQLPRLLPVFRFFGHEGTNGHLGELIVVAIVVESLIAICSRWVHGSFPARPLANVVDVTVWWKFRYSLSTSSPTHSRI